MATLVVTGGAGFIGSALIRHVIRETDYAVINVDKLTYAGNLESLGDVTEGPRYRFTQADVCDRAAIGQLLREHSPSAVLHLAAESHVDRSISAPAEFIQTNIVGTYLLLEAVRDYWEKLPPGKRADFRFLHVSTDEVYGDLGATGELFTETTPYAPSSPYSASKASADHLVRAWRRTYGLPVLITNCSNNYGPYQFPEKLIPLVITNALEGKPLPVYGRGEQVRDWLYVDDHARALMTVLERGEVGETYNIGGHNEQRNIDVVRQTCAILDDLAPRHGHASAPSGRRFEELIVHVRDRPGHDSRYAIDAGKMQRDLNWVPLETFGSGLRKTVEWYLANAEWVARVRSGEYRNWIDAQYGARA